jgi:uncharacterized protein (DUF2235 family)
MSKVIVFCADGTWNGPGQPDTENTVSPATDVFKLFLNLGGHNTPDTSLLADEQERVLTEGGAVTQCAKYLHGVGDSDNFLVKLLGGSMGAGLIARVIRGYTYISRNYVAGDRIVITGFSRGAYTARALAGMIARKGLLDAAKNNLDDKPTGYRLGAAVWYEYRHAAAQSDPGWMERLANAVLDLPGFFTKPVDGSLLIKVSIDTVAVWDTVGALGIPAYTLQNQRVDFLQFADTALSPAVSRGYHAVALDERRADFTPTLWDADTRIVQMVFPGSHADVGGGYPMAGNESGLSDCTLVWMTKQLQDRGVTFLAPPSYTPASDCTAPAHGPWLTGIWADLPKGPRDFRTRTDLLESGEVAGRLQGGRLVGR